MTNAMEGRKEHAQFDDKIERDECQGSCDCVHCPHLAYSQALNLRPLMFQLGYLNKGMD